MISLKEWTDEKWRPRKTGGGTIERGWWPK